VGIRFLGFQSTVEYEVNWIYKENMNYIGYIIQPELFQLFLEVKPKEEPKAQTELLDFNSKAYQNLIEELKL
jgi:hypothetical protein